MDKKKIVLGISIIILVVTIIVIFGVVLKPNSLVTILGGSGEHSFKVEISDTPIKQAYGLMDRKSLGKGSGMLFVWEDEEVRSFWMKNTFIPLDMIFIDENLTIVDINKNALPCTECISYDSKRPAKYVLEINGGLSDKLGINVGDGVQYDTSI